MIQHSKFDDGTYVLHKIMLNGHKYSCWFGRDGKPFSAERFSRDGLKTYNVPARHREVWSQLERIGRSYRERVEV